MPSQLLRSSNAEFVPHLCNCLFIERARRLREHHFFLNLYVRLIDSFEFCDRLSKRLLVVFAQQPRFKPDLIKLFDLGMQILRWMRVPGDILFSTGAALFGWFVLGLLTGHSFKKESGNITGRIAKIESKERELELV